jgi:hypothetical protein
MMVGGRVEFVDGVVDDLDPELPVPVVDGWWCRVFHIDITIITA